MLTMTPDTSQKNTAMFAHLIKLRDDRRGVTAIEYGLISALISVVIIIAVKAVGTGLSSTFSTIASSL